MILKTVYFNRGFFTKVHNIFPIIGQIKVSRVRLPGSLEIMFTLPSISSTKRWASFSEQTKFLRMIFFVNDGVKNQQVGLFREMKNFF